jgi:FtsZ-interacting cell division protein YlmF
MNKPQKTSQTNDPTLVKLLEADSDLAAQAAALTSQMEALKEKRQSLQTVIELFSSTDSTVNLLDKSSETNGEIEPTVSSEESSPEPEDTSDEPEVEAPAKAKAKKPASEGRKSSKVEQPEKSTGRDTAWRRYMRKEFAKTSLPEAVSHILHQQPNKVFEVPSIVDALFIETTPKDARNDARNRVSNVLSIGLKNNKWYRGKKGQYSLSQEAAKASVAS